MADLTNPAAREEEHLRQLLAQSVLGWGDYAKSKAARLADWRPEIYGHLPAFVDSLINPPPPEKN